MQDNPIPNEQHCDHLFLLVGTNPLPNYVAAKLLLQDKGQLYLIHSGKQGTLEAAERLESLLKQEKVIPYAKMIEVKEADAGDIYEKIARAVNDIKSGSVGLNYTGGTKVMAVQTHRALSEAACERKPAIFSYLDARSYEMRFDPIGAQKPPGQKVLLAVSLRLEELLQLHDVHLKPEKGLERSTVLSKSAQMLAKIHTDRSLASLWRTWCNEVLGQNTRDRRRNWLKESKLKQVDLPWPTEEKLQPLVHQLCEEVGIHVDETIKLIDVLDKPFRKIYHFCRWLDGIWLEYYVYDQIKQIEISSQLDDAGMSLDTVKSEVKPDFEVDIGVMRGYQLFGISCTTALKKSMTKSKLFEAYLRTSQLGGDEARTALVCPVENPMQLQKEIEQDVPDKVRVFGAEDLPNLKDQLNYWFTEADRN